MLVTIILSVSIGRLHEVGVIVSGDELRCGGVKDLRLYSSLVQIFCFQVAAQPFLFLFVFQFVMVSGDEP